jgi:trafficking protein particle complex subunit 10
MSLDFLPNSPPFSLSWHNPSAIPKLPLSNRDSITSKISRKELAAALGDKEAFDSLYVSITQKAIELYAEGKRRKFALKLHGDLAAFDEYDISPKQHSLVLSYLSM